MANMSLSEGQPGQPTAYTEGSAKTTILFGGRHINLYRLAIDNDMDHAHVWRIVTGEKPGSIRYASKIAKLLGMTFEDFQAAIVVIRQERLNAARLRFGLPQE